MKSRYSGIEYIATHGKPEILNSDQGSQFTSEVYIELLKKNEIQIIWMVKDEPLTIFLLSVYGVPSSMNTSTYMYTKMD